MVNENQNTEQGGLFSKITWFFQKSKDTWWEQKNQRRTKAFHLTRKDSLISVWAALVVVWWVIFYGKIVLNEYADINSRADELRELSSYKNVNLNDENLSSYAEWNSLNTISSIITVNNNIAEELSEDEIFKQQQKDYYEVLLQNIYLPSLNIWKDPYTKNFNMSILWQNYLDSDKFQDLYLIL